MAGSEDSARSVVRDRTVGAVLRAAAERDPATPALVEGVAAMGARRRCGENICPQEIENVLLAHPMVDAVAVVGVPDPEWGEQVAAFVQLAPGGTADEGELFDHVRCSLAPHKTPRVWRFVAEFPLTGSGKIRKPVLREQHVAAAGG